MPWVRFTANFDWSPRYGVTIAYKTGETYNVTRACAARALDVGRAERTTKPQETPCPVQEASESA
ncbi:hypothetical protein GCM10010136_02240 [Limoniibacter endophyticus]|uniref:Uncharacterized protein n=1 Tax=Limoniibacter endophyticus TaxID=1565040 RepID=A0A8J3DLG9_9HYPH|nr:hypothetical protein GCM10010136_02240 [Limoniibacter endophyticus]